MPIYLCIWTSVTQATMKNISSRDPAASLQVIEWPCHWTFVTSQIHRPKNFSCASRISETVTYYYTKYTIFVFLPCHSQTGRYKDMAKVRCIAQKLHCHTLATLKRHQTSKQFFMYYWSPLSQYPQRHSCRDRTLSERENAQKENVVAETFPHTVTLWILKVPSIVRKIDFH